MKQFPYFMHGGVVATNASKKNMGKNDQCELAFLLLVLKFERLVVTRLALRVIYRVKQVHNIRNTFSNIT
jgi:hypothetical protein